LAFLFSIRCNGTHHSLIADIDVYDIATGFWSTIGTIPDNYLVSDHATFVKDEVYIAGGYDSTYTAMTTVLKIYLDGTTFEEMAPLNVARGDIVGVTSNDGTSAYVAGGFSHEDWCQPLVSVEEYKFGTNEWTGLPDLLDARGEIVLVESGDHLYSLGGEGPLDYEGCTTDTYTVSTKTVATDRIELLMDGETEWKILESFPQQRFRFAAVGIAEDDIIYTFGGQTAFDADCQCFKTTNEVYIFGTMENVEAKGTYIPKDADAGSSKSFATALVAGALTFAFLYV
jgi:N-acetylneuraminic acid mutarotase